MTENRPVETPTGRFGLAVLALAGVAALVLVLWRPAGETGRSVLVLAATAVAIGIVLYGRRPAREDAPPTPAPSPAGQNAPPFALIVERAADPMLVAAGGARADLGGRRVLLANAAARELLRIQRSSGPLTMAIRAPEVLAAIDEALYEQVIGHALYQGGGVQDRVWRVRVEPLAADGGGRLALVTLRDETELRRSERTRADFLANASHELRTPLASLTGFIETLRGHARDDGEARDRFLAIMQVQAERMRRLIDDLLSLSRIELGEHIAPSGRVDLASAASDVLDALSPLAKEKGVAFAHALPTAGTAPVVGDRDQIVQVIQNLAENALKYTPAGGVVTISLEIGLDAAACSAATSTTAVHLSLLTPDHAPGRRYAALRVVDQGPGIARPNLPRLAERFYRVEGQKSGEYAGTGLGLAIVKHIVNRHRGGLTVESAEGAGATFTAYFPEPRPEAGAPA